MHELSIASSIVDTVMAEVEKRSLNNVSLISLKIGKLTDIVPEALEFGFQAITKDTILENTELIINSIPVIGSCNNCKKEFSVNEFIFVCPSCYSSDIMTSQGNELNIEYIEAD